MNEILAISIASLIVAFLLFLLWMILKSRDRDKSAEYIESFIDASLSSFP